MVEKVQEEPIIALALQRELWRHPGKWAAIKGTRLVAVGNTPTQALRSAARKGVKDPVLHRVPGDDDRAYVL